MAQGVSGAVTDKGSVKTLIPHVMKGVSLGIVNTGAASLADLHANLRSESLRFELRTSAGMNKPRGMRILAEQCVADACS